MIFALKEKNSDLKWLLTRQSGFSISEKPLSFPKHQDNSEVMRVNCIEREMGFISGKNENEEEEKEEEEAKEDKQRKGQNMLLL